SCPAADLVGRVVAFDLHRAFHGSLHIWAGIRHGAGDPSVIVTDMLATFARILSGRGNSRSQDESCARGEAVARRRDVYPCGSSRTTGKTDAILSRLFPQNKLVLKYDRHKP